MNENLSKENEFNLAQEINELAKYAKRLNSAWHRFFLGIIQGFGSIIGATILFSVFILIITQLGEIGVLKPFAEWLLSLTGNN